ncbi:hypothetical protein FALBO_10571 [Fusarium albosuccineum]|uniref:Uncharacterized protein n=1 Tax=Fusarium albosuccineum TaxID=1237068 RepID=A0A8H4L3V9_9HYPO|nr:hypothetical protein FALBO_10571 [Fusarium albosuccineum]
MAPRVPVRASIDLGSSSVRSSFLIEKEFDTQEEVFDIRDVHYWHISEDDNEREFDTSGMEITDTLKYLPTAVVFPGDGETKFCIGHNPTKRGLFGLKAALDPDLESTGEGQVFANKCREEGVEIDEILVAIYARALKAQSRTWNAEIGEGKWELKVLVVTVPVNWTQGRQKDSCVQERLRQALERAGFDKRIIYFESESEAAAAYGMNQHGWGPGEVGIMVDIGSFTYDMVSCALDDNNGFVQKGEPMGGRGGMGSIWNKILEKVDHDYEKFRVAEQAVFMLRKHGDIVLSGKETLYNKEEVEKMFRDAFNPALVAMETLARGTGATTAMILGMAAVKNKLVKSMIQEAADSCGIQIVFMDKEDPSVDFGVALSDKDVETEEAIDLLLLAKKHGDNFDRCHKRFESLPFEPESEELTIWPMYGRGDRSIIANSNQGDRPVLKFKPSDTVLMDPITLPIGSGHGGGEVLYRFHWDKEKPTHFKLEIICHLGHTVHLLRAGRERWRIVLDQVGKEYPSEQPAEDLLNFIVMRQKSKSNLSWLRNNEGEKWALAKLAHGDELQLLCRPAILGGSTSKPALRISNGFYTALGLKVPRLPSRLRSHVRLIPKESTGFDLALIVGQHLLYWELGWQLDKGIFNVYHSSRRLISASGSGELEFLFQAAEQGTQVIDGLTAEKVLAVRSREVRTDDEWMGVLENTDDLDDARNGVAPKRKALKPSIEPRTKRPKEIGADRNCGTGMPVSPTAPERRSNGSLSVPCARRVTRRSARAHLGDRVGNKDAVDGPKHGEKGQGTVRSNEASVDRDDEQEHDQVTPPGDNSGDEQEHDQATPPSSGASENSDNHTEQSWEAELVEDV